MLSLIMGKSGSGKTAYMRQQMRKALGEKDTRVILLVPEQFSFESERRLFTFLSSKEFLHTQVYSFTRLAQEVFSTYGGLAGEHLNEGGKALLVARAAMEVADALKVYGRQIGSGAFIASLCQLFDEFKNAGISPVDFECHVRASELSSEKIQDISILYTAYNALLEKGALDPCDDLSRAVELLRGKSFFSGQSIFIDDFNGFTKSQYDIIEQMLAQAKDVTLCLCADGLQDVQEGFSAFSPVKESARRLIFLAKKRGVQVARPVILENCSQYPSDQLRFLAENFLEREEDAYLKPVTDITLTSCADVFEEVNFVCSQICNLVHSGQYRFKDISVISRNGFDYETLFESGCAKYGIPYFADRRSPLSSKPLAVFLSSLFDVLCFGFRSEDVLSMAKTGIAGLDYEQIARLENYVFIWDIKGAAWKEAFTLNPAGLAGEFTPEQKQQLEEMNAFREKLINPILYFQQKSKGQTGLVISKNLYRLLEQMEVGQALQQQAQKLADENEIAQAEEYVQTWDMVMDILDQLAGVFAEKEMPLMLYRNMLTLILNQENLGEIPATLDQVSFGDADRLRADDKKCVFVIGLNQGLFPAEASREQLLSEKDREDLLQNGFEIDSGGNTQTLQELFYIYRAFTAPSEKLFISYPLADKEYNPLFPSSVLESLRFLFPCLELQRPWTDPLLRVQSEKSAVEYLAENYTQDSPLRSSLLQCLQKREASLPALQALDRAIESRPFLIKEPQLAQKLFGNNMALTASKVERFYQCRFSYFMQYALGAKPRRKAELSPIESGSLIHWVLYRFVKENNIHEVVNMPQGQLYKKVQALTQEYVLQNLGDTQQFPRRFSVLLKKAVQALVQVIGHMAEEFSQSLFQPQDFELHIGKDSEVQPLLLQGENGEEIWVEGVVDRVDVYQKDGRKYIRVVDYKSGSKQFNLSDVFYGLNMQMLLYLFSLCENGKEKYASVYPAGILYMPARQAVASVEREEPEQAVKKEHAKLLRANGLILDDPEVIRAMEKEAKGLFIPVRISASGTASPAENVASLEQLGQLKRYVEHLLVQMAALLHKGNIQALPCKRGNTKVCSYCDYKSACQWEDEDEPVLPDLDKEVFFKEIAKE